MNHVDARPPPVPSPYVKVIVAVHAFFFGCYLMCTLLSPSGDYPCLQTIGLSPLEMTIEIIPVNIASSAILSDLVKSEWFYFSYSYVRDTSSVERNFLLGNRELPVSEPNGTQH